MLSRCTNADCLEYGIKRCRVSWAIHRIIWGGFPPIKGTSLVNIRLGYHSIPSADRMYLLTLSLSNVQPTPCQACFVVGHLCSPHALRANSPHAPSLSEWSPGFW